MKRNWSLEAARALFPDVRERTARAVAQADALAEGGFGEAELQGRLGEVLERWAREMEALGVEVKGPWLVNFDSGAGYYCWKWPEPDLEYYHDYDEGFAGRRRIQ